MVSNMRLNIAGLRHLVPESIWMEIAPTDIGRVEREIAQTPHSNQTAKRHARLNRLSLYALQSWLKSQADEFDSSIEVFPSAEGLPWIWEITNGTALNIGNTRLVIIPSDFTDTEELIVPQEWIDVPNLVGSYYLAMQVDQANERICLWGYISYDEMKAKKLGKYDDIYRNYHIDREDLHSDFELLWMDCEISPAGLPKLQELPIVGSATVERLIEKIATPGIFSPRLDLKFTELAPILNSTEYLKILYAKRNQLELPKTLVRLGDWFNDIFDRVWQPSELVFPFKNMTSMKGVSANTIQSKSERVGSKIIDLRPDNQHIALIVHQQKISEGKTEIVVRICPATESIYLPDELTLNILDEDGQIIPKLTKKAQANNWLQLKFTGDTGDVFSTSIEFGENRSVEDFILN
jgi:Protein of unknown function (DUF1822)